MVIWFVVIWADIVQSGLYLGKLWECLFLCLPVLKLCRTLFLIYVVGRVWFFDCVVIGLVCVAADIS